MNIYFINRNSKWKGPFDVIDSRNKRIISIGDVCLRDTNESILFLFVENKINKWSSCKTIGYGTNEKFLLIGNTLLFSFDGIGKRHGNINLLNTLVECFTENGIRIFFSNAIEILEYKRDFWDFRVFQKLLIPSQNSFNQQNKEKTETIINSPLKHFPSKFASYFDEVIVDRLISLLNSGMTLRESYTLIRKDHPIAFRNALLKFQNENHRKSIYDKS